MEFPCSFLIFVRDHLFNLTKLEVAARVEFFEEVHLLVVEEDYDILPTDLVELAALLYKVPLSSVFDISIFLGILYIFDLVRCFNSSVHTKFMWIFFQIF